MNTLKTILISGLLLAGLQLALTGCVADVEGGGYYDSYYHGGPWYHDGPWMDGEGWGAGPRIGVGMDIHPPHYRR